MIADHGLFFLNLRTIYLSGYRFEKISLSPRRAALCRLDRDDTILNLITLVKGCLAGIFLTKKAAQFEQPLLKLSLIKLILKTNYYASSTSLSPVTSALMRPSSSSINSGLSSINCLTASRP